jgi:hypothetical protein
MTTQTEDRLAEIRRRIDELGERSKGATADAKTRIQRDVDELRQREASARAAARTAPEAAEEKLEQLRSRLDIAEHRLAAELADDASSFAAAVDAQLDRWQAYLERLQTKAARRAAREQAEAAIGEVRQRRNAVAERLAEFRASSDNAWRTQKERVSATLDELERKAHEVETELEEQWTSIRK